MKEPWKKLPTIKKATGVFSLKTQLGSFACYCEDEDCSCGKYDKYKKCSHGAK